MQKALGWAKQNSITWVVSVDGLYHSAKASVNNKRKNDRTKSLSEFAALVTEFEGQQIPNEKIKEVKRLLEKAAHVSNKIVAVGVKVFRDHGQDVIIFEMKVTPSMKNVVYNVHLVFDSKSSKCNCPNGWLFCSHLLAVFLCVLSHSTTD